MNREVLGEVFELFLGVLGSVLWYTLNRGFFCSGFPCLMRLCEGIRIGTFSGYTTGEGFVLIKNDCGCWQRETKKICIVNDRKRRGRRSRMERRNEGLAWERARWECGDGDGDGDGVR